MAPFRVGEVLALVGSRQLSVLACQQLASVALALDQAGFRLATGCATGADATVLASVPTARCFCAFGPGGAGAGPASAIATVLKHPGPVVWWAGGAASLPLRARLACRTRRLVSVSSGLVLAFGPHPGRGSLLAARHAVAQGLPVLALAGPGLAPAHLPLLGPGNWQAGKLWFQWRPAIVSYH